MPLRVMLIGVVLNMWCFANRENTGLETEYEYKQDTDRLVRVQRGPNRSIGKLDAAGTFLPDRRYIDISAVEGQPAATLINYSSPIPVYEYRSGRLIIGLIGDDGNFVPEVGSKVILFKEYTYTPLTPRIYNLPGYFVKKGENKDADKKERREGKAAKEKK